MEKLTGIWSLRELLLKLVEKTKEYKVTIFNDLTWLRGEVTKKWYNSLDKDISSIIVDVNLWGENYYVEVKENPNNIEITDRGLNFSIRSKK